MSVPKIYYLPVSGRAEFIKILFVEKQQKYEFVNTNTNDVAHKAPYGQLPLYEDAKVGVIAQTQTIVRYVAKNLGLYPSDNVAASHAEMVSDGTMDLLGKYFAVAFYKTKTPEDYTKETKVWLGYFNKILTRNNEGKGFVVGNDLTFGDLELFQILNVVKESFKEDILAGFPVLAAFHARIGQREHVAAYMASAEHLKAMHVA